MATLDSFREATGEPIQLDLANGYIADIRLNAGDINGRTITVELTDNGTPITDTTGITVALAYNTTPGSGLGDRVSMPAVFGTPTATYRVAVPRKALQHAGAILMGIEVSVNGTKTCSRNFHGIVERAVFDATAPDAQDQMGVLDKLIDDATTAINKAVSGVEIDREFGSQNRAIDYALKKGKGYAGRCQGDTFYVQLMLMLKYATKNSDVLGGCWQYTPQTAVTNAETGVKRVIIATSAASGFDIGSTVNVGTDKERNNAGNYSAARARTILSKTNLDANNTALNLDGTPITTTTACFVSSMPWKTGATDKLLGTDGRPSAAFAANHQPIRLQGIELFNGIYESDADLIANAVKDNDNLGRIELYRVFDITKASKTSTANYTKIGEFAARDKTTNDSWRYAEDFTLSNGVIIPTGLGATSTTGMCDAIGANPLTSQGLRQVRRFGPLGDGARCGAFAAALGSDLAYRRWGIGGRLSALGRTKA